MGEGGGERREGGGGETLISSWEDRELGPGGEWQQPQLKGRERRGLQLGPRSAGWSLLRAAGGPPPECGDPSWRQCGWEPLPLRSWG